MNSNTNPEPEQFPGGPAPVAVAKNEALYVVLGLLVPGLPALLLKDDKVTGGPSGAGLALSSGRALTGSPFCMKHKQDD